MKFNGKMNAEKEPVQTLIFMDFETAGKLLETEFSGDLQPRNGAGLHQTEFLKKLLESDFDISRVPRIAEMSFVFVPRGLFVEAAENMHFKLIKHENEGRVGDSLRIDIPLNIFTSQMNPDLSEEDWNLYESKRASVRLRRSELMEKNKFAEEWPAVHHLLKISPKPACLIAHNGMQFDFRILWHELDRNGLLKEYPIPEGVFLLDSYLTFLDIETAHHQTIQQTLNTIDWKLIEPPQPPQPISSTSAQAASPSTEEEEQGQEKQPESVAQQEIETSQKAISMEVEEDEEIICTFSHNPPPSPAGSTTSSVSIIDEDFGQLEKTTIVKEKLIADEEEEITVIGQHKREGGAGEARRVGMPLKRVHPLDGLDPRHPFRYLRQSEWCPAKRRRIPPHIFQKDLNTSQWQFSEHASERLLYKCGKFKLGNMFKSLIGGDFRAHRAQADSEALLQVSLAYGLDFLSMMDNKCVTFPAI